MRRGKIRFQNPQRRRPAGLGDYDLDTTVNFPDFTPWTDYSSVGEITVTGTYPQQEIYQPTALDDWLTVPGSGPVGPLDLSTALDFPAFTPTPEQQAKHPVASAALSVLGNLFKGLGKVAGGAAPGGGSAPPPITVNLQQPKPTPAQTLAGITSNPMLMLGLTAGGLVLLAAGMTARHRR